MGKKAKALRQEILGMLWPLWPRQGVRLEMGAGYPVKILDFTIKPFPLPLKGEIPQDHFQAHVSKDLNWFCPRPALPLTSCITFGMSLTLFEPRLSHLQNGYINIELLLRRKRSYAQGPGLEQITQ